MKETDIKALSRFIAKATKLEIPSDDIYSLLCRLAGTVSKQYDEEEQKECIDEELNKWLNKTNCFND